MNRASFLKRAAVVVAVAPALAELERWVPPVAEVEAEVVEFWPASFVEAAIVPQRDLTAMWSAILLETYGPTIRGQLRHDCVLLSNITG